MRREIEIFAPYGRKTEDYIEDDIDVECLTREVNEAVGILVETGEIDLGFAKEAEVTVEDSLHHESYQLVDILIGDPRKKILEKESPIVVKVNGFNYAINFLHYNSNN